MKVQTDRAFMGIAQELGLKQRNKKDDIKELVCHYLSSGKAGKWLLIVDNADDQELILGSQDKPGLEAFFPQSGHGHILLTTRSRHVALEFTQSSIIDIEQMDQQEAVTLFNSSLIRQDLPQGDEVTIDLLSQLAYLPLAITQAAAYLNQTGAPIRKYLSLLKGAESEVARVLGREFGDNTRYEGSRNAVGATWIVSSEQMQKSNPVAIKLLSFISCIEPKAIPQSLLPDAEPEEFEWAIGTLCSYSFLTRRGEGDIFDMHSLVHTATRGWLEKQGLKSEAFYNSIRHVGSRLPDEVDYQIPARSDYLPHAMCLLNRQDEKTSDTFSLFDKVGKASMSNGRFREAIRCFEEICIWKKRSLPETNPSRLTSEYYLARSYLNSSQCEKALDIATNLVKIQASILVEDDINRLASECLLGKAYLVNQQFENATKILKHVVKTQAEIFAEDDPRRLGAELALGTAFAYNHDAKDGIEILEHVVAVWSSMQNQSDQSQFFAELALAYAYCEDGRLKDSITKYETTVAHWKHILDEKDLGLLQAECSLAAVYVLDSRLKEGMELFKRVSTILDNMIFMIRGTIFA